MERDWRGRRAVGREHDVTRPASALRDASCLINLIGIPHDSADLAGGGATNGRRTNSPDFSRVAASSEYFRGEDQGGEQGTGNVIGDF